MTFNTDVQNNAISQADSLESALNSAISELKAVASSYYRPDLTQTGFDNNPNWDVDRGREVTLSGLGDLPADRPTLNIPAFSFNPEDYISADLLGRYSYDSDFFDNFLDARLRTFIDTESAFIAQDVQDALFQQTRERDLQTLNDALDALDRQQGRRGFPVPNSLFLAARADVIKRHQDTAADRNKEITALIAERAHDGRKHSIDAGIRMEDIRSRFQLEFGRLYWQASDYLIRKFEADVRAEIARFNGEMDMLKAKTATDTAMADFDYRYEALDQNKELARLQGHVQEMVGNIDTWKAQFSARIRAVEASVSHYSSEVSSWLSQVNAINYETSE